MNSKIYQSFLAILVLTALTTACNKQPKPQNPTKPNILFILTDDQGIGDLSLHGNDSISTPNMDALLTESAKFDRFYVSPVCAPTRASFLSGMYAPRTGAVFVTRRRETMAAEIKTIPEYLKEAGYRTGLFGKWHNGATKPYDPAGQGFDQFLGFCLGHFNDYFNGELENENNEEVPFSGDLTQILTDTASAFMLEESEDPFFCMLTYQAPHTPVQVADKYWDEVKQRGLTDYNTGIYAMIESIDDRIGQLLGQLEKAGKLDNTLIIFSTDNGPNGDRYRMGLKGTKGYVDEGSVRVPFGIKFPAKDKQWNGQRHRNISAHIDLLPTILDYLELPLPGNVDGRSMLPIIRKDSLSKEDYMRPVYAFKQVYDFTGYPGSVRNERYILVMRSPEKYEAYLMDKDEQQRTDFTSSELEGMQGLVNETRQLAITYNEFAASIGRPDLVAPPINLDAATGPVHLLAHEGEPLGSTSFNDEYGWANDWFVDLDSSGALWPVTNSQDRTYRAVVKYHAERPVQMSIQVDSFSQPVYAKKLIATTNADLPVADRVKRKEVLPRTWSEATFDQFIVPAGSNYIRIYTDDLKKEFSGLWVKEIALLK